MCCSRRHHKKKAVLHVLRVSPTVRKTIIYTTLYGENVHEGHLESPKPHSMLWAGNKNVSVLRDKNLTIRVINNREK